MPANFLTDWPACTDGESYFGSFGGSIQETEHRATEITEPQTEQRDIQDNRLEHETEADESEAYANHKRARRRGWNPHHQSTGQH
jgi:hypothetical protein